MSVRYGIKLKSGRILTAEGGCFGGLHNLRDLIRWIGNDNRLVESDVEEIIYISDDEFLQCSFEERDEYHNALFKHTIIGHYFKKLTQIELNALHRVSFESGNSGFDRNGLRAYSIDPRSVTADELMFMMFTLRTVNLSGQTFEYGFAHDATPENLEVRLVESILHNNYRDWNGNCSEYSTCTRYGLTPSRLIRAIRTFLLDDKFGITVKGRQNPLITRNGYSRASGVEVCRLLHGDHYIDDAMASRNDRYCNNNTVEFPRGSTNEVISERRRIIESYINEAKKTRKVKNGFISEFSSVRTPRQALEVLSKYDYTTKLQQGRAIASALNTSRG
jgi:hypothetical protein